MKNIWYDKNGNEINLNDHLIPDVGLELVIIGEKINDDEYESYLLGEQVKNKGVISILTQDNLSLQWSLK